MNDANWAVTVGILGWIFAAALVLRGYTTASQKHDEDYFKIKCRQAGGQEIKAGTEQLCIEKPYRRIWIKPEGN